jgi:hypothetical protein
VRIELPNDADVAMGDLETFLDYAMEKVPASVARTRAPGLEGGVSNRAEQKTTR